MMDAETVKHVLGGTSESSNDVPLEHMDYGYINESSNVKHLEKILKVLRSGKEGHYPELIQHCEKRIEKLDPKSKALRRDNSPSTAYDLGKEEWEHVSSDMKNFIDKAHMNDEAVRVEKSPDVQEEASIRKNITIDTSGHIEKKSNGEPEYKPSKKRIKSSDYGSWEKFDVEKEVERVDEPEETKNARLQAQNLSYTRSSGTQDKLKTEGLSGKEREVLANREKDKGNEAFRAGDYNEAILYYTRSLSVIPSAPAYNNRALARIRLERFSFAVEDCNKVLELEPNNLKAILRRGTAHKSLQQYDKACQDLDHVLSVEPGNKQAKDLLKDIKKKMRSKTSPSSAPMQNGLGNENDTPAKGRRMVIEEVGGSDDSQTDEVDGNLPSRKTQRDKNSGQNAGVKENAPVNEDSSVESGLRKEGSQGGTSGVGASIGGVKDNHEVQTNSPPKMTTEAVQTSSSDIDKTTSSGMNGTISPPPVAEPTKPLPKNVVQLKDEGTNFYKGGQYSVAKEKYSAAIDNLQKDKSLYKSALASLYSNRSACELKMGDCRACIEDCDRVVDLSPYNVKVYSRRANAYEMLERYDHAYLDFQQAKTFEPYNSTAQSGAARTMNVLKDIHGYLWRDKLPNRIILPALTTAQPRPSQAQVNGPPSLVTNGDNLPDLKDATIKEKEAVPEKVEVKRQETRQSKEERFQKLKNEGNDFVKKQKYQEAVDCYTSCTEIDPGQTVSFTNRALCYLKLNQNKEAEVDCTHALGMDDKNVKAFYRRALARKGLDNYFDSIKDLTALLKLEPDNASAKKELDIVKDAWRKELREKAQNPSQNEKKTSESSTKKTIHIEEAETDSEDEDDKPQEILSGRSSSRKGSSSEGKDKTTGNGKEDKFGKYQNNRTESKSSDKHKNMSRARSKKEEKETRNSKASNQGPKLNKVTAYEFIQAWMSLKSKKTSLPYAQILQQVPPEQLPTVLSNKLDASMLTMILKAVEDHLFRSDPERSYKLLSHLCKAQRFETVLLFMTNEEKQGIDKCLASLAANENQFCSKEDVEKLRKSFGLIC